MSDISYRFTHAITRTPAPSVVEGLRAEDRGAPNFDLMLAHHAEYVATLKSTGAQVVELPALSAFADSVFVEDTALCLPNGAVVMRPGAPSRLGEAAEMTPHLRTLYANVKAITGTNSYIEGGDILTTGSEVLVGRSARTNSKGIAELASIITRWGYKLREVITPKGVLHFKTDCSLLDQDTILSTERLSVSGCFHGYRVLSTVPGEEAAANAIRFNDLVLFPEGFPKTRDMLLASGYNLRELGNSECSKIDGGMSCLSLRFTPKALI
ncbi:MAG: dimethylargininase [Paracoccaceae bacterium]|jgi:dimethylargininase